MQDYEARVAKEQRIFENCFDVHQLPDIFHYWSNRHLLPKLQSLGLNSFDDFFLRFLEEQFAADPVSVDPGRPKRFVSIGSGNCDFELGLARRLHARNPGGFEIECIDLNPAMLERGRAAAAEAGLEACFRFTPADFNAWNPPDLYDAVIANQSLHHVVNLEGLFVQLRRSLRPSGVFIISDMIGRNGHQRWPEALDIVHEFWRKLPPSYRFNRRLKRYEELFRDWDCSTEGFEGIRAQDILPLLVPSFHFRFFLPFANVIDPFVDRGFGFNFKAGEQWDRDFIDAVHLRDEEEMNAGRIKPTHMLAALSAHEAWQCICPGHLTPEFCVRDPAFVPERRPVAADPYEFAIPPREAAFLGGLVESFEDELLRTKQWALVLQAQAEAQLNQKTAG